jgi:tRNA threonylcarbamoyladenosine biosynthesis protein TsaE
MELGERLGRLLKGGEVLAMVGELAAGKTTMTRGIAIGMELDDDIHSPTFTLIHEHEGNCNLNHIDLYRLETEADIESLGLDDYIYGKGVAVIEWADRLYDELPEDTIVVSITSEDNERRKISFETTSQRLQQALEEL